VREVIRPLEVHAENDREHLVSFFKVQSIISTVY
jgi:hypothetical protein